MEIKDGSIVYSIFDRNYDDKPIGVYSRSYHDEFYFESAESARRANVHNIYTDKSKYKVKKYRVHLELIEDDVECNTPHLTSSGLAVVFEYDNPDTKILREMIQKDMEEKFEESLTHSMEDEIKKHSGISNLKRGAGVSLYGG